MKKLFISILLIGFLLPIQAQNFNDFFEDKTLRIDYNFAGDVNEQTISIDQLNVIPRWYGKHHRLAELPMEGNGQITVRNHKTNEVIYRNSFSTLFQEWLTYPEASTVKKAFENVLLIPMPKDTVDVTLDLRNNRREIMATLTHQIIPTDILIRHIGEHNITKYTTIQQATDTSQCIHIAYIAEGYKQDEMDTFIHDARVATEAIFAHEPFKSHRSSFNIIAVEAPSVESGTSEPSKGVWKNTALHSHFDTFYSDRYLTTLNLKDMHNLLAGTAYEHIIVLVNTDEYGGGGILNSYNLSMTHHNMFKPVVVHEFGHSFGGLADEYAYDFEQLPVYPHDVEPWEKNITTLVDFNNKWENLMPFGMQIPTPLNPNKNVVGVYEGAGYSIKGVYRPMQNCRMRTNEYPDFCPACQQALTRLIDFYTNNK